MADLLQNPDTDTTGTLDQSPSVSTPPPPPSPQNPPQSKGYTFKYPSGGIYKIDHEPTQAEIDYITELDRKRFAGKPKSMPPRQISGNISQGPGFDGSTAPFNPVGHAQIEPQAKPNPNVYYGQQNQSKPSAGGTFNPASFAPGLGVLGGALGAAKQAPQLKGITPPPTGTSKSNPGYGAQNVALPKTGEFSPPSTQQIASAQSKSTPKTYAEAYALAHSLQKAGKTVPKSLFALMTRLSETEGRSISIKEPTLNSLQTELAPAAGKDIANLYDWLGNTLLGTAPSRSSKEFVQSQAEGAISSLDPRFQVPMEAIAAPIIKGIANKVSSMIAEKAAAKSINQEIVSALTKGVKPEDLKANMDINGIKAVDKAIKSPEYKIATSGKLGELKRGHEGPTPIVQPEGVYDQHGFKAFEQPRKLSQRERLRIPEPRVEETPQPKKLEGTYTAPGAKTSLTEKAPVKPSEPTTPPIEAPPTSETPPTIKAPETTPVQPDIAPRLDAIEQERQSAAKDYQDGKISHEDLIKKFKSLADEEATLKPKIDLGTYPPAEQHFNDVINRPYQEPPNLIEGKAGTAETQPEPTPKLESAPGIPNENAPIQTKQIKETGTPDISPGEGGQTSTGRGAGKGAGNKEAAGGIQEPANKGKTAQEPSEEATGLARRYEDHERLNRGVDPTAPSKITQEWLADQGKRAIESGEIDPAKAVRDSIAKGRPLTDIETSAVAHYKRSLRNEANDIQASFDENMSLEDSIKHRASLDAIETELNRIGEAAQITRGRGFSSLGRALNLAFEPDYSISELRGKAKAYNDGRALPEATDKILQNHSEKIKQTEVDLAKTKKEVADSLFSAPGRAIKYTKDKLIQIIRQGKNQAKIDAANFKKSGNVDVRPGKRGQGGAVGFGFGRLKTDAAVQKAVRDLAVKYTQEGATTLRELLNKFKSDVKAADGSALFTDDEVLDMLSGKHKVQRAELTAEQEAAKETLQSIKRAAEFKKLHWVKKYGNYIADGLSAFRAGNLLGHPTGPFVQGRPLVYQGNALKYNDLRGIIPSWGSQAWIDMFPATGKGYFGKKGMTGGGYKAQALQLAELKNDTALWSDMKKTGFIKAISRPHGTMAQIEEENFGKDIVGKVPVIGNIRETVKPGALKDTRAALAKMGIAERGSAGFDMGLNEGKIVAFKQLQQLAQALVEKGVLKPEERLDYLTKTSNMLATMMGKSYSPLSRAVSNKFSATLEFAPRYLVSKAEYATGMPLINALGNPAASKQVARMYAAHALGTLSVGTALVAGLRVAGYKAYFDVNPASTLRGNVVFEGRDGKRQAINIAGSTFEIWKWLAQFALGKVNEKGERGPQGDPKVFLDAGLNKAAPGIKMGVDLLHGAIIKKKGGEMMLSQPAIGRKRPGTASKPPPPKFPWMQEFSNTAAPIAIKSPVEAIKGGASGPVAGTNAFGVEGRVVPRRSGKAERQKNLFGGFFKY